MKNFIFGFVVALVILGVALSSYTLGKRRSNTGDTPTPSVSSRISPTAEISESVVGGDRDEHGCIGSAGYSWCEVKQKCLRSWEESCEGPSSLDAEKIKQALVAKHSWNADDIIVTISTNDGTYASGGVNEKDALGGGGYFFAAKKGGTWNIVADGNGTISCESLVPFPDFPSKLIPECWNESTGKVVVR